MKILIGSTIPAFKMTDDGHWWHWLQNADAITRHAAANGHHVDWLAVLQVDGRGDQPFTELLQLFEGRTIRFSVDVGDDAIDSGNRLIAICTGRNLMIDHALRRGHDWIYFADADISAPDDILPQLLELNWPVCGAHVPTYCLDGPAATEAHYLNQRHAASIRRAGRQGDVRIHWNTAGSLLVARDVFRRVPWRHDPDAGNTDDPATQTEYARNGWVTLVRHDVVCRHHPDAIGPLEQRGHDLAVYR